MPIDPSVAVGAELPERQLTWTSSDVLQYHLALGAGAEELRYVYERDLQVLPTFAVVTPTLGVSEPPKLDMPGIDVDLSAALHGRQELVVHRPLPVDGETVAKARIADIHDKGTAALIVTETTTPYFTLRGTVFVRGEGGFGGSRGPTVRHAPPDREPDVVLLSPTLPQQAAWYRLCGDRNPLHIDPGFAALAGFPRPILHGLCTYGIVAKAAVDHVLEGDPDALASFDARFAGVVYPGETLRVRIWCGPGALTLVVTVADRDDAPALSDALLTTH
ncbi:MAG TPA: MaoC/PaaZ C-terminal domain-containing protein [Kineosporiaceae bacterium]